ncbi:GGDEF domain-containing protein [Paraburkholderia sp. 40]|uniref:GGDEF domain-containing protein n=1 Tax=Paraburkholderia sp. 40 TaxID=2991059 RepID=UPI003D1BABFF
MKPVEDLPSDVVAHAALLRSLACGPTPIAVYDQNDVLVFSNAALNEVFRIDYANDPITFTDLILHGVANGCGHRLSHEDPLGFIADTRARRRAKLGCQQLATELMDGRWFWVTESMLPTGWVTVIGSDISELKQSEEELKRARDAAQAEARSDALTGLANRRYALALFDAAISTSIRTATPLSIALLDLDCYKQINDRHGHLAGDDILRDFAQTTLGAVRRSDIVGRIGGDEFLIVLPGASLDEASAAIERLRREVSGRTVWTNAGRRIRYAFSAGVCEVLPSDDARGALSRADRALYAAKRAGRNQVKRR